MRREVKTSPASAILPGAITIDGLVFEVERRGDQVTIIHRNVRYLQAAADPVVVLGRVPREVLDLIREADRLDRGL